MQHRTLSDSTIARFVGVSSEFLLVRDGFRPRIRVSLASSHGDGEPGSTHRPSRQLPLWAGSVHLRNGEGARRVDGAVVYLLFLQTAPANLRSRS